MTPIKSRMLRNLLHRAAWYDEARIVKPEYLHLQKIAKKVGMPVREVVRWDIALERRAA